MSGQTRLVKELQAMALLEGVEPAAVAELARQGSEQSFAPATLLIEEGRVGAEVYFLLDGNVRVDLPGGHTRLMGAGSTVGELALLDQNRRSADVRAEDSVRALVVHGSAFHQLMVDYPRFRAAIEKLLGERPRFPREGSS